MHKVAVDAHADLFEGKQSVDQKELQAVMYRLTSSQIRLSFLSVSII
jgi:hypothetical protein